MDKPVRRSDERYFADIRAVLDKFYRPGDSLTLTRRFYEARKCQMCGDKVDIRSCFELQNDRTKQRIVCGRHCIVKYATVVEQMNQQPVIKFPDTYEAEAAKINELRPNTVTVLPLSSFPDFTDEWEEPDEDYEDEEEREMLMGLGLDPDDPDYSELAPHGMSGDEDDEEAEELGSIIEDYMDDEDLEDDMDDDDFEDSEEDVDEEDFPDDDDD
jgi:hypothetical protein